MHHAHTPLLQLRPPLHPFTQRTSHNTAQRALPALYNGSITAIWQVFDFELSGADMAALDGLTTAANYDAMRTSYEVGGGRWKVSWEGLRRWEVS